MNDSVAGWLPFGAFEGDAMLFEGVQAAMAPTSGKASGYFLFPAGTIMLGWSETIRRFIHKAKIISANHIKKNKCRIF